MKSTNPILVTALPRFTGEAERIARHLGGEFSPYHKGIFAENFSHRPGIVAVMAAGIVVRSIAPHLSGKWQDPAVVVVSPDLSYAVPLIGGHHGANEIARRLSLMGITPVFTTATEALGRDSVEGIAARTGSAVINRDVTRVVNAAFIDIDLPVHAVRGPAVVIGGPGVAFLSREGEYSVGIGCRRGITGTGVRDAVLEILGKAGIESREVMVYATTEKKAHEHGLFEGIGLLGGTMVLLGDGVLEAYTGPSRSAAHRIGLSGVAEPAALAASVHKELVREKAVSGGVTVAIAR